MKRIDWQSRVLEQASRMHRMAGELSELEEEQRVLRDRADFVRQEMYDLEVQIIDNTKEPWDD